MKTKYRILSLLQAADGQFLSGEALSEQLSVSRTAIWKAVHSLKEEGYSIQAVTNKGYRLCETQPDILSSYELTHKLDTTCVGRTLEVLEQVDSTNSYAKMLLSHADIHGHAVLANAQTKGKSKDRSRFFSPENDGVYLSIVLTPKNFLLEQLSILRQGLTEAVFAAVQETTGLAVSLREASELVCGVKKVGGLLTELGVETESGRIESIVFGVGFYVSVQEFPVEHAGTLASLRQLSGVPFSRNDLARSLLRQLDTAVCRLNLTESA